MARKGMWGQTGGGWSAAGVLEILLGGDGDGVDGDQCIAHRDPGLGRRRGGLWRLR